MDLLLPFPLEISAYKIDYHQSLFFIGSCFSEEIGGRLAKLKSKVLQNPHGILFDPVSISKALKNYTNKKLVAEEDLFQYDGLYHSWQHHSKYSGAQRKDVLHQINGAIENAHTFAQQTNWLFITLGTSFQYVLKSDNTAVANCHKVPGQEFNKRLLPVDEMEGAMSFSIREFLSMNPGARVVLTVSPVRHTRDGVTENNRSKARLIETCHLLKEKFDNVTYFPAYELVIDVLRDYRFYKPDLVHVSDTGIDFVFEKFCEVFMSTKAADLQKEIKSIIAAREHRPFHSSSEAHQNFRRSALRTLQELSKILPGTDFSDEMRFFSSID